MGPPLSNAFCNAALNFRMFSASAMTALTAPNACVRPLLPLGRPGPPFPPGLNWVSSFGMTVSTIF